MALVNDYDLAIVNDNLGTREATSKHRTGTAPFMAMQLLAKRAPLGVTHIYAYELESWFYILLHIALGYTHEVPKKDLLCAWRSRSWDIIFDQKLLFLLTRSHHEPVLAEVRTSRLTILVLTSSHFIRFNSPALLCTILSTHFYSCSSLPSRTRKASTSKRVTV
jgi:hypothetical protein